MMSNSPPQNPLPATLPDADLRPLLVRPTWTAFPRGAVDQAAPCSAAQAC